MTRSVQRLFFTDSTRLLDYFRRYHVGKDRLVAITGIPGHPPQPGSAAFSVLDQFDSMYTVTVYEGHIIGKLRRAVRVLEVDQGLYQYLMSYTGSASNFYFDRLDNLIDAWTARKRKLMVLRQLIIDSVNDKNGQLGTQPIKLHH